MGFDDPLAISGSNFITVRVGVRADIGSRLAATPPPPKDAAHIVGKVAHGTIGADIACISIQTKIDERLTFFRIVNMH